MQKPNIVFISTDQMRDDYMGCAGHRAIQTVAIDHLARRGLRFEKAFSSHPVCIPARASIMTGLEGHTLGITEYREGFELPTDQTLPKLLNEGGYQTKVVGKMHTYPERCHYGFESMLLCEEGRKIGQASNEFRGYDDYEQWLAEKGYAGQAFSHGMANNDHSVTTWHLPDYLHPSEWIGSESCKAIKNRDWTRPLFLWTSFTAPHPPLTPLLKDYMFYEDDIQNPVYGKWLNKHPISHQNNIGISNGDEKTEKEIMRSRRAYCALITQIDRQINRIIGTLREEGLLENTWFIFTSDHGDNLGDHQLWGKNNFLRGSSQIPFIITPPTKGDLDKVMGEQWMPGTVTDSVAGLQDILPTCLDIAGLPGPDDIDGQSLLPVVYDSKEKIRDVLLGEIGHKGMRSFMLTDGIWKYIWYEQDHAELLFHIGTDPYELEELSDKDKDELLRWRRQLIDILSKRESDRAIVNNTLKSSQLKKKLSKIEKSRLATDHNVRGLHT